MVRRVLGVVATLGVLAWPGTAWACGMCMDQGISIRAPYAGKLIASLLLWLMASLVLSMFVPRDQQRCPGPYPTRKAAWKLVLAFVAILLVVSMLTMGSVLIPAVAGLLPWVGYIFWRMGRSMRHRPFPRIGKLFVVVHLVFMGLSVGAVL